jgi:flagellar FliJ protein
MKPFTFRLATLLRLKEAARDEARARLAQALRAEQLLLNRIEELHAMLAEVHQQLRSAARPGRVEVDQLVESQRYELLLKAQRDLADQQRQAVAREIDARRAAAMEADRQVCVLQKLREKQQARHQQEAARSETKRLDELAIVRHGRLEDG